jgi:4-hydroxy-3-polyprenylbenzoate decarboxylase
MNSGRLVVAITGASGAIYAYRFLLTAREHFREIYLAYTEQASQVARAELGWELTEENLHSQFPRTPGQASLIILKTKDFFTPPASGSFRHEGMVIIPCSMGTLARIANGISDDLITRSADVTLKEKRKLIVVPRETPFNLVMLRNMLALAEAGATILPAAPAWYHRPQTLEQLADTVVARVLQHLGVEHSLVPQWGIEE